MDWQMVCIDPRNLPSSLREKLVEHVMDVMTFQNLEEPQVEEAYKKMGIMSAEQILHLYLTEEGILGYTATFIKLFNTLEEQVRGTT